LANRAMAAAARGRRPAAELRGLQLQQQPKVLYRRGSGDARG
jgi:hypothetical protein